MARIWTGRRVFAGVIRGFFLLLILLSVGGWVWSAFYYSAIGYSRLSWARPTGYVFFQSHNGFVYLLLQRSGTAADGWVHGSHRNIEQGFYIPVKDNPRYHSILDIGYIEYPADSEPFVVIVAPHWFLILIASLLFIFIWRVTRSRMNPKIAFPVELSDTPPTPPPSTPVTRVGK